jgi:micrococcal nuclease
LNHNTKTIGTIAALLLAAIACGSDPIQPPPTFAPPVGPATTIVEFPPSPTPLSDVTIESPETIPGAEYASVTYVIDGDTIDVSLGGDTYRVRYIGVNTPERDEPCYQDATDANRTLVEDQIVGLVKDVSETDQYGRLLRYVYVGDTFVNESLVKGGWAEARRYPPDTLHYDEFDAFEQVAYAAGLGCWPTGVFQR